MFKNFDDIKKEYYEEQRVIKEAPRVYFTDEDCEIIKWYLDQHAQDIDTYRKAMMSITFDTYKKRALAQVKLDEEKNYDARCTAQYFLITINPREEAEFSDLKKLVDRAVKKKWIKSAVYSFEQRSEEKGEYYGYHCHMVIDRGNKVPSQMKSEFKNTFKGVCNSQAINIKALNTMEDVKKAIKYLSGEKKDEDKQGKVANDSEFRNKYNLKDVYIVGETLPITC